MNLRRRVYALLNLGRDNNERRSTNPIDWRILTSLKRSLPRRNWVVFFVEINEGDDNNERRLIRSRFPGARLLGANVREPIMVSPDLAQHVDDVKVQWVPDTAVKHWTPMRSILRVRMDNGETLFGAHYAAGANGQGSRPQKYRGPLQASWDNLYAADVEAEEREHALGRDVTWMKDANAYDLATFPQRPGQRTIVHERTDWGRVWAAAGREARFRRLESVDIALDSHNILRMQGNYR